MYGLDLFREAMQGTDGAQPDRGIGGPDPGG